MTLSIIIPVYNTEKYLNRCIDSILNQDNFEKYVDNLEILLINDGSPDNSQKIIDSYSENFQFIKGYIKKNGGPSDARNFGLTLAKNEYIWFIDSDDWIDKESFDIIFSEIEKNNLETLEFDSCGALESNNTIKLSISRFHNSLSTEALPGYRALEKIGYISGVCFKVSKRSIYTDNNLTFPLNEFNEDDIIAYYVVKYSKLYKKINTPLYYYYARENSTTHNRNSEHLKKYYKDILNNLIKKNTIISSETFDTSILQEMQYFYTTNLLLGVLNTKNMTLIKEYISALEKNNLYPIKPYKYHNNGFKRSLFIKVINNKLLLKMLVILNFTSKKSYAIK